MDIDENAPGKKSQQLETRCTNRDLSGKPQNPAIPKLNHFLKESSGILHGFSTQETK